MVNKNPDLFAYHTYEDIRRFAAYDKKTGRYYISQTEVSEKTGRPLKTKDCRHLLNNLATAEKRRKDAEEQRFDRNNLKNEDLNQKEVDLIHEYILSLSPEEFEQSRGFSLVKVGNFIFGVEHESELKYWDAEYAAAEQGGYAFILVFAENINNLPASSITKITELYARDTEREHAYDNAEKQKAQRQDSRDDNGISANRRGQADNDRLAGQNGNGGEGVSPDGLHQQSQRNLLQRLSLYKEWQEQHRQIRQDTLFNRKVTNNSLSEDEKRAIQKYLLNLPAERRKYGTSAVRMRDYVYVVNHSPSLESHNENLSEGRDGFELVHKLKYDKNLEAEINDRKGRVDKEERGVVGLLRRLAGRYSNDSGDSSKSDSVRALSDNIPTVEFDGEVSAIYSDVYREEGYTKEGTDYRESNAGYSPLPAAGETSEGFTENSGENSDSEGFYGVKTGSDGSRGPRVIFTKYLFNARQGRIFGFNRNGEVYLNTEHTDPSTPVHEYTHDWVDALRELNPELYKRGMEIAKESSLWGEIMGR